MAEVTRSELDALVALRGYLPGDRIEVRDTFIDTVRVRRAIVLDYTPGLGMVRYLIGHEQSESSYVEYVSLIAPVVEEDFDEPDSWWNTTRGRSWEP